VVLQQQDGVEAMVLIASYLKNGQDRVVYGTSMNPVLHTGHYL